MKYMIVTQTFPPRTGGMQNVMDSISKRLSVSNETHIFPDHYLSKEYSSTNLNIHIHNNFSPKILRPFIKKLLINVFCKSNDVIICDSWKSLNAIPKNSNKVFVFAHGQEFLSKDKKVERIKKSLSRASCIICSSNYTANLIDQLKITNIKKLVIEGMAIELLFLISLFLNVIFFELNNFISFLSFKRMYFFMEEFVLSIHLSRKSISFKAFKKSELNPTSTTLNFDLKYSFFGS